MYNKERFLNKPCIYTENKNTIFKNRYEEHLVVVKEIKEDENGISFVFSFCETLEEHRIFIPRKLLKEELHSERQVLYKVVDSEEEIHKKEKERKLVFNSIKDRNLLFYSLDSTEVANLSDFPKDSLTFVGWFWADDFCEVNGILKFKGAPCRCIFRTPENRYWICYQSSDIEKLINKLVYGRSYLSYD